MRKSLAPYMSTIVAASGMAFISAHVLWRGDARNTLPWGVLALGCGLYAANRALAWKLGATFGFVVSYCFLWFDNTDPVSLHQFVQLFLLIPLPSLFGALCGSLLSRGAFSVKQLILRGRHEQ